jgi:predicted translin family RNA/ssDNA-binding protein
MELTIAEEYNIEIMSDDFIELVHNYFSVEATERFMNRYKAKLDNLGGLFEGWKEVGGKVWERQQQELLECCNPEEKLWVYEQTGYEEFLTDDVRELFVF